MTQIIFDTRGFKEFERAIKRNPELVVNEAQKFLARGMAAIRSIMWNNPWQMSGGGGGIPVDTRNLQESHKTIFDRFSASIGPGRNYPVEYGLFVHEGTKRMKARPWLDYAKDRGQRQVEQQGDQMFANIVSDLSKQYARGFNRFNQSKTT